MARAKSQAIEGRYTTLKTVLLSEVMAASAGRARVGCCGSSCYRSAVVGMVLNFLSESSAEPVKDLRRGMDVRQAVLLEIRAEAGIALTAGGKGRLDRRAVVRGNDDPLEPRGDDGREAMLQDDHVRLKGPDRLPHGLAVSCKEPPGGGAEQGEDLLEAPNPCNDPLLNPQAASEAGEHAPDPGRKPE
jgi:hypothetical protein